MIRVMLVDDHRFVRDLMRVKLESDGSISVVAEAGSGEEARRLVESCPVDVVLMDLNMPGMGGVEATARLVNARPGLRVVAVSVYDRGPEPVRFLAAGGVGYISKADSAEEMVAAVKRASNGSRYVSAAVAGNIVMDVHAEAQERLGTLTGRELQILRLLADGLSVHEIASDLHIAVKTVRFHRQRLMEKLEVDNDVQLARIAWELGLVAS